MNDYLERLPFRLGDVLVRDCAEEAWLAGATVFEEDAPVAVLFRAPASGRDCAVYVRVVAPFESVWLGPCKKERGIFEPPSSLEETGVLYRRARRLPLHASPIKGSELVFDIDGTVLLAEYRGPVVERLVRISRGDDVWLFEGQVMGPGSYDRFPGR